jgi:hypothetical protein
MLLFYPVSMQLWENVRVYGIAISRASVRPALIPSFDGILSGSLDDNHRYSTLEE